MISVCIATYNGEKFIEKQLLSILNQREKVDEVIICDDRSTDNTVEIVKKFIKEHSLYNSWHLFINKQNVGFCVNFYGAIFKAKGDLIFLCDQDDIWCDNKTQVMHKVLKDNPDIWVLASRYQLIDKKDQNIKNLNIPYYALKDDGSMETVDTTSLIGCSFIRGFSICFKSEIKKFLRPIDVKSLLAHDWYISILGSLFGKTVILNRVLCKYRFHDNNVSLSDIKRKDFLGSFEKRILGLKESVIAHSYILYLEKSNYNKEIEKFIKFEKKRLEFLKTKNPFLWLFLVFYLKEYKRYYKSLKGGFRVWLGDFCYGYNINLKKIPRKQ